MWFPRPHPFRPTRSLQKMELCNDRPKSILHLEFETRFCEITAHDPSHGCSDVNTDMRYRKETNAEKTGVGVNGVKPSKTWRTVPDPGPFV